MSKRVIRNLVLAATAVSLVSTASAIDINSSNALQYYGDNDLDFEVSENGDTKITNGGLNITGIANFTDSGISLYRPLSVESSGPLSVQNGIDLTGTGSNTIDSYSTFYLSTSGSPSDIVLDPSGVVGTTSTLDMGGNNITDIGGLQDCGANEFINGNGECEIDTDTDTDNQDLADVLSQGNSAGSNNIDLNSQDITNVNDIFVENNIEMTSENTNENSIDFSASRFLIYDSVNGQEELRVNRDGNVDVPNGDVRISDGALVSESSSTDSNWLQLRRSGSTKWNVYPDSGSTDALTFEDDGASGEVLRLKRGGNVEIPNGNLQMNGNRIEGVGGSNLNFGGNDDEDIQINVEAPGEYEVRRNGSRVYYVDDDLVLDSGNIDAGANDINNPGQVDGVDLDNPGNAITLSGSQYAVASGSIDDNEIADNTVDNSEIQNSGDFTFNRVSLNGRLDMISGKGSNNIYDDGDLVVDSDDSIEFADSGTTYMEIGTGASAGNTQISDTGEVTTQGRLDVNTDGGEISDDSGSSMDVQSNGNVVVTLG
ncbi:hypothetical protein [Candidatus Nanohalococcus occultus]|uniref:hypothetical protein n=1 Tax=Candidatus Nanohalococcus occultus TaxID=2978047 RepID=UPI00325FDEFB